MNVASYFAMLEKETDMADRAATLRKAIATNQGYLANRGALEYHLKLVAYQAELDALMGTERLTADDDPADWTGSYQQALDRLTAGADELLEAAGKPFGHDGAERGALDRATYIELATSLGVLDELGGPTFFGPTPEPGTTA